MDPLELGLVYKAIRSGLANCVVWFDDKTVNRVRSNPSLQGLNPTYIKQRTIDYVVREGGIITQVIETRPLWKDRQDYWYKVIVPEADFPRGIFVEIVLINSDEDCPEVALVNAHEQRP